jgi:hypothetical protein
MEELLEEVIYVRPGPRLHNKETWLKSQSRIAVTEIRGPLGNTASAVWSRYQTTGEDRDLGH